VHETAKKLARQQARKIQTPKKNGCGDGKPARPATNAEKNGHHDAKPVRRGEQELKKRT